MRHVSRNRTAPADCRVPIAGSARLSPKVIRGQAHSEQAACTPRQYLGPNTQTKHRELPTRIARNSLSVTPGGGKCQRIANGVPSRTALPSPARPLFDSVCLTVVASNLSLDVCRVYRNFYHPVLVRTWWPESHLGAGVRLCGSSLKFSKLLRSSLPDRRGADRAR